MAVIESLGMISEKNRQPHLINDRTNEVMKVLAVFVSTFMISAVMPRCIPNAVNGCRFTLIQHPSVVAAILKNNSSADPPLPLPRPHREPAPDQLHAAAAIQHHAGWM